MQYILSSLYKPIMLINFWLGETHTHTHNWTYIKNLNEFLITKSVHRSKKECFLKSNEFLRPNLLMEEKVCLRMLLIHSK